VVSGFSIWCGHGIRRLSGQCVPYLRPVPGGISSLGYRPVHTASSRRLSEADSKLAGGVGRRRVQKGSLKAWRGAIGYSDLSQLWHMVAKADGSGHGKAGWMGFPAFFRISITQGR